ncbi:MAG: TM2 domain-containing protein [Treponema sp.]|nr:TM2 domain-containing protein [Treponema sp.]
MYNVVIAYLLWLVSGFGALGFHRFYLGKIPTGLVWMFSGGLFGIGSIYDFFTLPGQVRQANIERALLNGTLRPSNEWRNVNDGQARIVTQKENTEQAMLKVAKANAGIITASELALEAKISIEEAKKALDAMVSKGHAELRVRQSGSLVYAIPDIMDSNEPLVD